MLGILRGRYVCTLAALAAMILTLPACDSLSEDPIAIASLDPEPCDTNSVFECPGNGGGGGGGGGGTPSYTYKIETKLINDDNFFLTGYGFNQYGAQGEFVAEWRRMYAEMTYFRCSGSSCAETDTDLAFTCFANGATFEGSASEHDGHTDDTFVVDARHSTSPFGSPDGYHDVEIRCDYTAASPDGPITESETTTRRLYNGWAFAY